MSKIVSVIVPVYKVEKYLNRAVDSILNQTYRDLEIILVDDGSPDNSGNICDVYAMIDSRVKVIHKNNGGLSSARNVGLDKATGKYIFFLDSDDFIQPHTIERLLSVAEKEKCDIVQCQFFRFETVIPEEKFQLGVEYVSSEDALAKIDDAVYMAAWNKIYRSSIFKNIRFPEGRIHEDVGCTYKLFYISKKTAVVQDALYGYYVNPDSITTSKIKLNKLDLLDAYEGQMRYFDEMGLEKNKINSANNLAASFGTLLSYDSEKYEDYRKFEREIQKKFASLRHILLKIPIRWDLRIAMVLSLGNVKVMKWYHRLKQIR